MQVALSNLIAAQLQRAQAEKAAQASSRKGGETTPFAKALGPSDAAGFQPLVPPTAQVSAQTRSASAPAPAQVADGAQTKGAQRRPGSVLDLTV